MPKRLQLESLQNELASISALLSEAELVKDPVGSLQFSQRKKEIVEEIQAIQNTNISEASVAMYFRGGPVIGSRAISADFAGRALSKFQEIVTKQFAKTELGSLGERGPIPLKTVTDLMLTGVAQGSFGFILEEINEQPHLLDTALKETVDQILLIINAAGAKEDAEFNTVAEDLEPRTLIALRDFFTDLDSNKATLRLVDDKIDLSLDEGAICRARVRTEHTQIDEKDELISGILVGFLSVHRRFELKLDTGETISGSAIQESADKFVSTMSSGKSAIGRRCVLKITKRIVKSLNRPDRLVYRLLEFVSIGQDDSLDESK